MIIHPQRTLMGCVLFAVIIAMGPSPAWADDLDFQASHGNDIARIAIVGDERWRDDALLYVGKGFRRTGITFFTPDALEAAKAWLLR